MFYAASFRLSRLEITYPGHGARVDTATPTITGVAPPGTVVSLTMDPRRSGSTRALGTATAGDDHTWSLAVTAPLCEPLAAWRAWALLCAAIEAGDEDAAVSLGVLLVDVLAASSPLSRLDVERAILDATGAP